MKNKKKFTYNYVIIGLHFEFRSYSFQNYTFMQNKTKKKNKYTS
jgi:hypothetical protein